jgi:Na+/alanine symporter
MVCTDQVGKYSVKTKDCESLATLMVALTSVDADVKTALAALLVLVRLKEPKRIEKMQKTLVPNTCGIYNAFNHLGDEW